MTKLMEKAERISLSVEGCARELLEKLCEGESDDVRRMAWDMLVTRMAFANGQCDCFVLPPLDEV